jgi:hypothetical protein
MRNLILTASHPLEMVTATRTAQGGRFLPPYNVESRSHFGHHNDSPYRTQNTRSRQIH